MKRLEILFGALRVPLDAVAVAAALLLAYELRVRSMDLLPGVQLLEPPTTLPGAPEYLASFVVPGAALFILLAALLGLYTLTTVRSAWREVGRTIIACALWLSLVIAWYFLVRKQLFYSRVLLLHAVTFAGLFVLTLRAALTLVQRAFLRRGYGVRSVLTVGAVPPSPAALATLMKDIRYAYRGHVDSLRQAGEICTHGDIDLIIQTDARPGSDETAQLIDTCRSRQVAYAFLPPLFTDVPHLLGVERLGLLPLLQFQPTPLDGWGRIWKALFDAAASLVIILVLLPLFLLITLCILIEDGWPVFFVSRRIGEKGRGTIPVVKFRSMVKDAERKKQELSAQNFRSDGPLFKVRGDPRVTRVGRVLRRWSLDELPQFFNVLAGHMALVGPRPHLPEEVARYSPYERRVFVVRPGVTGLAQISGRSDLSFSEEVHLDLQYIEEWSPFLDLWVLWRTVVVVLTRKGAE
ncbi:MAG: UDP-phosphate galactose phosphotransferase [Candidatus Peregrinibacteria bacterium Gr01-1014_25]|nr:MAG: UDP-phosphate galactose phosphotransferase [Candidatus Peregrinibacteria bacterium Gr01-1014_25]